MKLIRAIDNYFFLAGESDFTDRIWFYGTYTICLTIVAIIVI